MNVLSHYPDWVEVVAHREISLCISRLRELKETSMQPIYITSSKEAIFPFVCIPCLDDAVQDKVMRKKRSSTTRPIITECTACVEKAGGFIEGLFCVQHILSGVNNKKYSPSCPVQSQS
jgi:hypothetical protein